MVTISFSGENEAAALAAFGAAVRAAVLLELPVLNCLKECTVAPSGNGDAGVLFIDRVSYRMYISSGEAEGLKEVQTAAVV